MVEKKKSHLLEAIIIAAILLLLWKATRKKKVTMVTDDAKAAYQDPVLSKNVTFDLNDYCQKVVYKPLALNDLQEAPLLGTGWCARGDRSYIDPTKGFGDDFRDVQAVNYIIDKQNQAIMANNRKVIQFRLINTSAGKITTKLLNLFEDPALFSGAADVPVYAPVVGFATGINASGFTGNWGSSSGALGYIIDVATDSGFLFRVPGYDGLDVGNVNQYVVSGLSPETYYYYRIRAYNSYGESANSNVISVYVTDNIVIGTQVWMGKNVPDPIPGSKVLYNDEANRYIWGGYYNFSMIAAIEALYPGYHVPTKADWETLRDYLGGYFVAGKAMKEAGTDHWNIFNTGDNSSGWTGLGGGVFYTTFNNVLAIGNFMSSTPVGIGEWFMHLDASDDTAEIASGGGIDGNLLYLNVRLVKNLSGLTVDNDSLTVDSDIITVDQA